jgi:hypothetical protein
MSDDARDEEFVKKVKDDIKQVIEEYECDPSVDLDNCDKDFNISFDLPFCLCPCYNTIYLFLFQDFFSSISVFSYLSLMSQEDLKYTVYLN